jgi:hypothetical protein
MATNASRSLNGDNVWVKLQIAYMLGDLGLALALLFGVLLHHISAILHESLYLSFDPVTC